MELKKVVDETVIGIDINRRQIGWKNILVNGQEFDAIISSDSIPSTVAYTGNDVVYGVCYSTLAYRKKLEDRPLTVCSNPSILPIGSEWIETVLNCVGRSLKGNEQISNEIFIDISNDLHFLSCPNISYNIELRNKIFELLNYDINEVKMKTNDNDEFQEDFINNFGNRI